MYFDRDDIDTSSYSYNANGWQAVDERHRTNQQIHDTRYQLNELQQ